MSIENKITDEAEKKINLLTPAFFANSINLSFPFKSTSVKLVPSSGLVVDASITAVISLKANGNVSGFVKSPYTSFAPSSFKKFAFVLFLFKKLTTVSGRHVFAMARKLNSFAVIRTLIDSALPLIHPKIIEKIAKATVPMAV